MATLELNKIEEKLTEICTYNLNNDMPLKSDSTNILLSQMQMIAFNNKMALKLN